MIQIYITKRSYISKIENKKIGEKGMAQAQILNKPIPNNQRIFLNVKVELSEDILKYREYARRIDYSMKLLKKWYNDVSNIVWSGAEELHNHVNELLKVLEHEKNRYEEAFRRKVLESIVNASKQKIDEIAGQEQ